MQDLLDHFRGRLVLTVPHMDDCVLGCGGLLAMLPEKKSVHIVYATDGMGSPEPLLPWRDHISPNLGEVRMVEARDAMGYLGVPEENVHFIGLPDGKLTRHTARLRIELEQLLIRLSPDCLLAPFRYDRHPDHIALNHSVLELSKQAAWKARIFEYFVYHHWRLLPSGDVRNYLHREDLLRLDVTQVSTQKRSALEYFKSQTTRFYAWQTRPNLSPELLEAVSQEPEYFLPFDESRAGTAIFHGPVLWIRIAHRLEPLLKKRKDQAVALLKRGANLNGR